MDKADQRDFDSHYEYWDKIKGGAMYLPTECPECESRALEYMPNMKIRCHECGYEWYYEEDDATD